jgi:hypothetical protein
MVGMVEMVNTDMACGAESTKDRILGVNTPRQHVLPRVRYGAACLVNRNTIGCVSCSNEWGLA